MFDIGPSRGPLGRIGHGYKELSGLADSWKRLKRRVMCDGWDFEDVSGGVSSLIWIPRFQIQHFPCLAMKPYHTNLI